MIGETGANVNKIIVLGDKEFITDISDELFNRLDVRATKGDIDNPCDPHLLLRHIRKCEIIIISLEYFTSMTMAGASMARALDKLVVGIATRDFFNPDTNKNPAENLLMNLCDFGCVHEDVVSEVNKYL